VTIKELLFGIWIAKIQGSTLEEPIHLIEMEIMVGKKLQVVLCLILQMERELVKWSFIITIYIRKGR
jgi:hypothetical protein